MTENKNLIQIIIDEALSDDKSPKARERELKSRYLSCSDLGKEIVDEVFLTLTGWTLKTLINMSDGVEE